MKLLFASAVATLCSATEQSASVNPIRKVVSMLQNMQGKIEAEGEKEKDLFEKFMCYCKNGKSDLEKSISAAEEKLNSLPDDIKAQVAALKQLKEDVKKAKADRTAAKAAMAEATALREKEAAAFAKESGELKVNVGAIAKAVTSLEKGMGGAFLQTQAAQVLRNLITSADMEDLDRSDLTAFLSNSNSAGYAPASGQIVGILKQMGDTMAATLKELTDEENTSIANFDALMKAKTKEVNVLTAEIETKIGRIGKVGVEIVEMKEDLDDTEQALAEDKKFLAELEKGCATKEEEWAVICKFRSEELVALADTIKILNDDDALELFKKTLPGASSFLQVDVSMRTMRQTALEGLQNLRSTHPHDKQRLDFILLALHGKKVGFDKVIGMIDNMVDLLGKEQADDDAKKEKCLADFDAADDKKKGLERDISKLEASIEDTKEGIKTLTEEIAALREGIVELDKTVAEATENRKEENSDYQTLMASDTAAKQVLEFAKNRLNKFYNPKLYKAPPKRELSEEERITVNMGGTLAPTAAPGGIAGTGIALMSIRAHGAPPPPPETFGAYSKKGEESGGVIAMIDLLIKDLATELTEAETNEKLAQEEYEQLMADAAEKRASDSKSLTEKEASKSDLESELIDLKDEHTATVKELMATVQYIGNLHAACDWLIKYYDVRKTARVGEVDSLKKAKAVLSGADFSFVQVRSSKFLERA